LYQVLYFLKQRIFNKDNKEKRGMKKGRESEEMSVMMMLMSRVIQSKAMYERKTSNK